MALTKVKGAVLEVDISQKREEQTATVGQTVFTLTEITYNPGVNNLSVFINGVRQGSGVYTETDSTTVTFSTGLTVTDVVEFITNDVLTSNVGDAAAVNWTQSGTGAVTRSVENTLRDTVSVKDFGAVGDGVTDDWDAFDAALVALDSAGGGRLHVPQQSGSYYRISQALRMRFPNITIECESPLTRIHNTNDRGEGLGSWPNYACFIFGTDDGDIGTGTNVAINAITRSDESVTTTTAGDASSFSVGDVVFINVTTTWDSGGGTSRPQWGQVNVVTSADAGTGVVGLRHPIKQTESSVKLANLSNPGVNWKLSDGTDTGVPGWATRDNRVLGGWWSTDVDEAPFANFSGAIDCEINVDRITCRSGAAYGNLMAHCSHRVRLQETRKAGIEIAYCSHDNYVHIENDELKDESSIGNAAAGAIWINEGAEDNSVYVRSLHGNNFPTLEPESLIKIANSQRNFVSVDSAVIDSVSESVCWFHDVSTANMPVCQDNLISVGEVRVESPILRFIKFQDNGNTNRNTVSRGRFYGTVTSDAIQLNGDQNSVKDCWFESGDADATTFAPTNFTVENCYVPDGIRHSGTVWDAEYQNGNWNGLETDAWRLFRQARIVDGQSVATNASPYTLTSTVKGSSLQVSDSLNFFLASEIPGGSSSDNKTFLIEFGGSTVRSYVTTSSGASEVIIRGSVFYRAATAVQVSYVIYQDDSVTATGLQAITGLTMSNDNDLVITITPTNVGDAINTKHAQVVPTSGNTGSPPVI